MERELDRADGGWRTRPGQVLLVMPIDGGNSRLGNDDFGTSLFAPESPHRAHQRVARLGLGAHPPSARPHCAGGGISLDSARSVSCWPGFFLPVRLPPRLFLGLLSCVLKLTVVSVLE
jgi:hypothetical protein